MYALRLVSLINRVQRETMTVRLDFIVMEVYVNPLLTLGILVKRLIYGILLVDFMDFVSIQDAPFHILCQ